MHERRVLLKLQEYAGKEIGLLTDPCRRATHFPPGNANPPYRTVTFHRPGRDSNRTVLNNYSSHRGIENEPTASYRDFPNGEGIKPVGERESVHQHRTVYHENKSRGVTVMDQSIPNREGVN